MRALSPGLALSLALVGTAPLAYADTEQPGGPRLLHVPTARRATEQGVLTPVPIALDVPPDLPARRVLLHYHVFGAPEWRTLELHRQGARYVGAIPCLEVSEMTSEIRYYIRAHDAAGAVIAFSATRSSPYVVAIHHPSARPDLGAGALRCPDPAECPPGLPGCPSAEVERVPCEDDRDCEGGLSCDWDGFCGEDPRRRNWFGIELAQSAGLVEAQGACSVASQENRAYACFRQRDGAIYTGRPVYSSEPLAFGRGPTRLLLSYERLLFYNTSLGIRLGYAVVGSGPTLPGAAEFVPYSGELTARYWLGRDPFGRSGLRAYLMVGSGFAEYDVETKLTVREDPDAPYTQGGNDLEQTLRVWKRAGDVFVSAGAGAMYPFSESFAAVVEVSACQAFPFSATLLTGNAGLRVGLR
jgi:hypothetical protein